jgi:hypothetical protein
MYPFGQQGSLLAERPGGADVRGLDPPSDPPAEAEPLDDGVTAGWEAYDLAVLDAILDT